MNEQFPILIAEDSESDALLLTRALREVGFNNPFHISTDGNDILAYLKGEEPYQDRERFRFPRIVFIDLRLPRMDGFAVLEWLKNHEQCNVIPRIVLSTSNRQEDIQRAYKLAVNSYVLKPATFDRLVDKLRLIFDYWEMCEKPTLPSKC